MSSGPKVAVSNTHAGRITVRYVLLAGVVALALSSCVSSNAPATTTAGGNGTTTASFLTTTSTVTTSPSTSTTEETTGPYQSLLFMLHQSGGSESAAGPFLAPVGRNTGNLEATIGALLSGLSSSEIDLGITSAVPENTFLNSVRVDDRIATVDLTSQFNAGAGTFSMRARLAQLVYTVTGYDTAITGVRLELDGTPVSVFSSEGLVLDDPMTRASFEDLLPGILVERPAFDSWSRPPVTITGSASTFQGVFHLEILDGRDGDTVADVPIVQTDNAAGWGRFSITLEASELPSLSDLSGDPGMELWIRVYELSPEDGTVMKERVQPFGYRMNP